MIDFLIIKKIVKNNIYYEVSAYKNKKPVHSIFPHIQYNRKVYNCSIYQLNDVIADVILLGETYFGS